MVSSYFYRDQPFRALTAKSLPIMTDADLCTAIASGGEARNRAIEQIYNWQEMKQKVAYYVQRHGGSRTDGLDIYHDGIVALDRNIREGKYRAESGIQGYFYTICRFIWNNEWRRRIKTAPGEIEDFQFEPDEVTPEIILRSQEERTLLRKIIDLLDESCKKILTLWKLSYSMAEIAAEMKLSSPEMAKKYKFRCMGKLMGALEQHPQLLNALKDV
jgi:RNA polymerase sigma factor (sigma-70 family)